MQQQHPHLPSWQFLVQAINDFAATLAPSARSAFEAVAQHHVAQLTPVVMAPVQPELPLGAVQQEAAPAAA